MPSEIDLGELVDAVDDKGTRRDRWGRYLIVPRDGGAPVGYRRVTTIAKALDSEGSLIPWSQGRVLLGAIRDPATLRKVRQLVGRHADPWYEGDEAKTKFKGLINELAVTGGREAKAILGTNLHALAAARFAGTLDVTVPLDPADELWLLGYERALASTGVVIDPTLIEQIVVHDDYGIAGTADYLRATVPGFSLPLIADLKTGSEDSLPFAVAGFTIQLGCYASADARYIQGEAVDGSQDQRLPMPELDQERGLVIHAPSDGSPPTFLLVDLAAGRRAFELARDVEEWRTRGDLAEVLDLTPALQASLEELGAVEVPEIAAKPATGPLEGNGEAVAARRAWLQGRIDVIGGIDAARADLNKVWPEGVPPLRRSDEQSPEQLIAIEQAIDGVEKRHSLPFPPRDPAADDGAGLSAARLEYLRRAFPGSTVESGGNSNSNS